MADSILTEEGSSGLSIGDHIRMICRVKDIFIDALMSIPDGYEPLKYVSLPSFLRTLDSLDTCLDEILSAGRQMNPERGFAWRGMNGSDMEFILFEVPNPFEDPRDRLSLALWRTRPSDQNEKPSSYGVIGRVRRINGGEYGGNIPIDTTAFFVHSRASLQIVPSDRECIHDFGLIDANKARMILFALKQATPEDQEKIRGLNEAELLEALEETIDALVSI